MRPSNDFPRGSGFRRPLPPPTSSIEAPRLSRGSFSDTNPTATVPEPTATAPVPTATDTTYTPTAPMTSKPAGTNPSGEREVTPTNASTTNPPKGSLEWWEKFANDNGIDYEEYSEVEQSGSNDAPSSPTPTSQVIEYKYKGATYTEVYRPGQDAPVYQYNRQTYYSIAEVKEAIDAALEQKPPRTMEIAGQNVEVLTGESGYPVYRWNGQLYNTIKEVENAIVAQKGWNNPHVEAGTYTVKAGDTLWNIAKSRLQSVCQQAGKNYGNYINSYISAICSASGISNPSRIYPGTVLTLPRFEIT